MKHALLVAAPLVLALVSTGDCWTEARPPATRLGQMLSGSADLRDEITRMDSTLFAAFNVQNIDKVRTMFTEDLEFYHDNEGLTTYAQTMADFKAMFAQESKISRELLKGSLEVYPIKNYGAIEIGSHRFCHVESGRNECGTFKFVHVWRKAGTEWKLSRIVSYDH
jgi:ketosteroid isomerase-like protein